MSRVRVELLELSPEALVALSNAGLVKRSQKELAAGNVPTLEQDEDGTLHASFSDGTRTRLASGRTLKEAECNCSASGLCRHRIMLVLAYQQSTAELTASSAPPESAADTAPATADRWQPGQWLAELATLPAATQKRARVLADKGLVVELNCQPGSVPAARLPMSDVRFFSRSSMRFARCDCVQGTLCEHVILAVQAFAEAEARHPGFTQLTWQIQGQQSEQEADPFADADAQACRQTVIQLSHALWSGGISQPAISLDQLQNRAQRAAQSTHWRWVAGALQQVTEGITAVQERATHYRPGSFLTCVAMLAPRLLAAGHMASLAAQHNTPAQPWRNIVGLGVGGDVELDHLRLVSLGMLNWQDSQHYGIRIWFTDPDTGSILHLSRQWPLAEQTTSPAWRRRLAGFQASMLAGGQIIAQSARRHADGELQLQARARFNSVVPLSLAAWDLPDSPLCQPGVVALRRYLHQRAPGFVRPLNQTDNLFILPVGECRYLHWDAARQTLDAEVISGEGDGQNNLLRLSLRSQPCSPHAIDRLVTILQQQDDPAVKISGLVVIEDGKLTLEPMMLMTKQRAWVLHADADEHLQLPANPRTEPLPAPLLQLHRCREMLIQWLHNGLRYQQQQAIDALQRQASELSDCGFDGLARLLRQLPALLTGSDSEKLVHTLNAIVLLRDALELRCLLVDE